MENEKDNKTTNVTLGRQENIETFICINQI